MNFITYVILNSLSKLYSNKYKNYLMFKSYYLSGGTFNINE